MSGLLLGLNIPTSAAPGADPVALAREAEALGFDFVSASDHLHGGQPTHETWTMLAWIAAATTRIRVATRVLAVPYRHPPVLAKMAETFDRRSGGRRLDPVAGPRAPRDGAPAARARPGRRPPSRPRSCGNHLRLQRRGGARGCSCTADSGVGLTGGGDRPAPRPPGAGLHRPEFPRSRRARVP